MAYVVEVDQSIKIEQSGDTVLAFADGISHAIVVPSHVKTEGFRALRRRGKSKEIAYLLLFSASLYLLLKEALWDFAWSSPWTTVHGPYTGTIVPFERENHAKSHRALKDYLDLLDSILIDQEYWGHGSRIKSFLLEYIKRDGLFLEPDKIHFGQVGRGSPSDQKARAVREGKDQNYRTITVEEMLVLVA